MMMEAVMVMFVVYWPLRMPQHHELCHDLPQGIFAQTVVVVVMVMGTMVVVVVMMVMVVVQCPLLPHHHELYHDLS